MVHRFLAVIGALLLAAGVLVLALKPASAQQPCTPATPGAVGYPSNFNLSQHTLASIRWPSYSVSEIVFRVPLGVQAAVYGGLGSYWVYDPGTCSEAEVDRQAWGHASRIGTTVTNIYSIPSYLVQVGGGIGYQPPPYTPPPYTPPPTQPAPPYVPPPYMPPYYPVPPNRPVTGPNCPQVAGLQTTPWSYSAYVSVCTYNGARANVTVPAGLAIRWRYYIVVQTWWPPYSQSQEVTTYAYAGQTIQTDWFETYYQP